jgi:hypothetical protein
MSRIGCERRGDHWHCHTAADLLALLNLQDDGAPIDCADAVVTALLEHLARRGIHLAPGGHDLLHVTGAPMTAAEARAVRLLRRELHALLLIRSDTQPGRGDAARTERSTNG